MKDYSAAARSAEGSPFEAAVTPKDGPRRPEAQTQAAASLYNLAREHEGVGGTVGPFDNSAHVLVSDYSIARTRRSFIAAVDADEDSAGAFLEAREAARELARRLPAEMRKELYAEHGALVDKDFTSGLSARETTRLRYLRWQLARIEDAEIGHQLDRLEALADLQEAIAQKIDSFATDVAAASDRWKKRQPRHRKR